MSRICRQLLLALAMLVAASLGAPAAGHAQSAASLCEPRQEGVNCGPGNNRQPAGGGKEKKVPHNDALGNGRPTRVWPKISGILWMVVSAPGSFTKEGGPANDELLGHHGSERLYGRGGHDVLWGDWDPVGNTTRQREELHGGPGNDWLYPSRGTSKVFGGPGVDYVWAYYGKGTIDCGPGIDTARVRTTGAFRLRSCEKVRHFCAHGEDGKGNCLSPTGKPVRTARRR